MTRYFTASNGSTSVHNTAFSNNARGGGGGTGSSGGSSSSRRSSSRVSVMFSLFLAVVLVGWCLLQTEMMSLPEDAASAAAGTTTSTVYKLDGGSGSGHEMRRNKRLKQPAVVLPVSCQEKERVVQILQRAIRYAVDDETACRQSKDAATTSPRSSPPPPLLIHSSAAATTESTVTPVTSPHTNIAANGESDDVNGSTPKGAAATVAATTVMDYSTHSNETTHHSRRKLLRFGSKRGRTALHAATSSTRQSGSRYRASGTLQEQDTSSGKRHHVYGKSTCDIVDLCEQLPQWKQVAQLYGPRPVILGLETCATYRQMLQEEGSARNGNSSNISTGIAKLGVTGLYNSGTNALMAALADNFPRRYAANGNSALTNSSSTPIEAGSTTTAAQNATFPRRADQKAVDGLSLWEVPWGKHVPWSQKARPSTTAAEHQQMLDTTVPVLPIVIVRDPFRWMASMCKMNYDAEWMQVPHGHCPNLVPIPADWDTPLRKKPMNQSSPMRTYQVTVRRPGTTSSSLNGGEADTESTTVVDTYDSLADMWTAFYNEYENVDIPRLIVRFEDLLFHREYVLAQIAQCADIRTESPLLSLHDETTGPTWKYRIASVKDHGPLSKFDLVSAVIQYGTSRGRYAGMANEDIRYAAQALNRTLLQKFSYRPGPVL